MPFFREKENRKHDYYSFGFLEKITFINKDSFDVNASMSHLMIILKKKFFSANEKKSQTTKISLLFDIEKY